MNRHLKSESSPRNQSCLVAAPGTRYMIVRRGGDSGSGGALSNLYIRVFTGFYSNPKTLRLRVRIGDDAFWVPLRMWALAAEEHPDGDLSTYSSEELAELLHCPKYASSIKQALIDVGFMDADGSIHDWEEHNGFHAVFQARARKAAKVKWDKYKKEKAQKKKRIKRKGKGKIRQA